ncbi:hypothetical protein [Thiothrix sp.]|jgi:hypothetical protein|uniref:hypothetical protein n=1 Tax=Thiothrix sp. TaxID=1032 RepID=UPI00257CC637|nr:hypothetical protein [Thiothrix sp.]
MKMSKRLFYAASSTVMSIGMMLSSTANASGYYQAGYYSPCNQIKNELTGKVQRLRQMARDRESYGDAYGARRLRNTANVITAHIGNLPCVGKQTCLCD